MFSRMPAQLKITVSRCIWKQVEIGNAQRDTKSFFAAAFNPLARAGPTVYRVKDSPSDLRGDPDFYRADPVMGAYKHREAIPRTMCRDFATYQKER